MKWNQFRVSHSGGEREVTDGTFFPRVLILSSSYTSRPNIITRLSSFSNPYQQQEIWEVGESLCIGERGWIPVSSI
jgi:hypothetical protein